MSDERTTSELIQEFAQNPGTESETIDFKSKEILETTEQKRDLVKLLSEMANNRGGSVIIGVRIEDGDLRLQGFDVDSEYKQEIAHIIYEYASSHLTDLCEFRFDNHSGKTILRIDVEEAQERLVKVEIDGEQQIRIRDLDGGREMTSAQIKAFYEQAQQAQSSSEIPEISESKEVEAVGSEYPTKIIEPFNSHPTVKLDSDDFTAVFVNALGFPVYGHTHTYRLESSLSADIEYRYCIKLLDDVAKHMGGDLRHGFGYTFRWGDTQVIGRTIDALKADLGKYQELAIHLSQTGESTSIYQPILAGAVRCGYGLFWFELQRESDDYVRGEFQLIAPDVPVESSDIEKVFSSHGSIPNTFEQRAGVQILRVNLPRGCELEQPVPRAVGMTNEFEIVNVVCDNPVYQPTDGEATRLSRSPTKQIVNRLSQIQRLPFDIAGGYLEDHPDNILFRRLRAMVVGATFPTLIVEPRAGQREPEDHRHLDLIPVETASET